MSHSFWLIRRVWPDVGQLSVTGRVYWSILKTLTDLLDTLKCYIINTVDLKFLWSVSHTKIVHYSIVYLMLFHLHLPVCLLQIFLYLMPHTHFIITKPRWPGAYFRADTVTVIIVDIVCVISVLHILSSLACSLSSFNQCWVGCWLGAWLCKVLESYISLTMVLHQEVSPE